MTAALHPHAGELDLSGTPQVPLTRLVAVELRKMADTRAGRWLLITIALLTALAMTVLLIVAITQDAAVSYFDFSSIATVPMALLLPVLGILSVTSEWGQRTHMVTFTLEPRRARVVVAKLVSGVLVALAAVVVSFAIGAVCNLIYGQLGSTPMNWDVGVSEVVSYTILHVLGLLTGFAFGMLIINTAAAIVVFFAYSFVLPGITGAAAVIWSSFKDLQPWVDFAYTQTPLTEGDLAGVQWPEFFVSGLLWFVLPLALGIWRLMRAEVK
jgi:ABC-type transport system involved in multi-copper enzyme maturation permease subunit